MWKGVFVSLIIIQQLIVKLWGLEFSVEIWWYTGRKKLSVEFWASFRVMPEETELIGSQYMHLRKERRLHGVWSGPHSCHYWGFCWAHLCPTRNIMLPTKSTLGRLSLSIVRKLLSSFMGMWFQLRWERGNKIPWYLSTEFSVSFVILSTIWT